MAQRMKKKGKPEREERNEKDQASRLEEMAQAMYRIASGDFSVSLDTFPRQDELDTVAHGISMLAEETGALVDGLRAEKDFTENIIRSLVDTLILVDKEGNIKTVNRETCELLGYTEDELVGSPVSMILAEEEEEEEEEEDSVFKGTRLTKLIEEGSIHNYDMTYLTKTGEEIPVSFSGSVMRDEEGELVGIVGIARDITERKRAEEALRESEEKYRRIVETAIEGIISLDSDARITFINQQMASILEYTIEEMLGQKFESFLAEDQLSDHYAQMNIRAHGEDAVYERCLRRKDGGKLWALISAKAIIDSEGTLEGSFAMLTDITRRKAAEEAVRESETMLRNIFDSSPLAVGVYDGEGRLAGMNRTALAMFGAPDHGGAKGHNPLESFLLTDEAKDRVRNEGFIRYETEISAETLLEKSGVGKHGKTRTVYLRMLVTSLGSEEGSPPVGYMVQCLDISDQKWAQVEISRLSRRVVDEYEEARTRIAIDLHDEFGQSITALKIEIDMLMKEAGDRLGDQTERLEGMVALLEDTLDKIRSISGELRPILLDDFGLEKALGLYVVEFSRKTGIAATADCDGIPAHLGGNVELALFRIAQEALVNIARHASATQVRVSLLREEGLIILTVTDNGRGFDVDKALRGDSTHSPFGIMGMRERTDMVGGEFNMSSKTGKGTTVVARVPLDDTTPPPQIKDLPKRPIGSSPHFFPRK